mmetsp:Transcript_8059/g.18014  ORF Transcript_8059/g.18014 Transcript_8059/m.18014 type:complete len:116 (-) Transcript_8059:272-619(-)
MRSTLTTSTNSFCWMLGETATKQRADESHRFQLIYRSYAESRLSPDKFNLSLCFLHAASLFPHYQDHVVCSSINGGGDTNEFETSFLSSLSHVRFISKPCTMIHSVMLNEVSSNA